MTNRGESEVYEMLFAVVKSLVDWPQEVSITKGLRGGHPLFTVVTHPKDVGKVIGSGGRTARAIRIIMRELIVERTRAGLEVARQLGRMGGRKRLMTESKVKAAKKLLASGVPARDVAGNLGVSGPYPI